MDFCYGFVLWSFALFFVYNSSPTAACQLQYTPLNEGDDKDSCRRSGKPGTNPKAGPPAGNRASQKETVGNVSRLEVGGYY